MRLASTQLAEEVFHTVTLSFRDAYGSQFVVKRALREHSMLGKQVAAVHADAHAAAICAETAAAFFQRGDGRVRGMLATVHFLSGELVAEKSSIVGTRLATCLGMLFRLCWQLPSARSFQQL